MNLLHNGVDTAVIALWLGHADIRSTTAYLHADMTIKEQALQRMATTDVPAGRYQPTRQAPRLPRRPVTIPTPPRSNRRTTRPDFRRIGAHEGVGFRV